MKQTTTGHKKKQDKIDDTVRGWLHERGQVREQEWDALRVDE